MMAATRQLVSFIRERVRATDLDLRGSDLTNADLSGLSADRLNLAGADLRAAKLRAVRLGECRLAGVVAEYSDWAGATLRTCVLDGAHGAGARFDGARIEDSTAIGADLSRASLRGAHLTETSFARAVMREAVLDNAEGDGVEFRGADLGGASLVGARFDEADFRGADLCGADLSRGRFHSADFRGAILDGTRFDDADCAGSWFDVGAGPYAETTSKTREKSAKPSFDEIAAAALRDGLASLPGVFATREGAAGELLDHLQSALNKLSAAADAPSGEWKRWLEPLMKVKKEGQPLNVRAVLDALCEGTTGLRNMLAEEEGPPAEILDRLQHLADTLGAASDQPPEEWKVWLEPLMKMTNEGRPLEGKALLDALAALAQSWRPGTDEPRSPPVDRKDQQREH